METDVTTSNLEKVNPNNITEVPEELGESSDRAALAPGNTSSVEMNDDS